MEKLELYWIWFAQLKGLNLWTKHQLLQQFHDPEEIYQAQTTDMPAEVAKALQEKDLTEASGIYDKCRKLNIRILTCADTAYPERLRYIEDPPVLLYVKGMLPDWQVQPVIGVVGTRKASTYGLQIARQLSAQIATCGGLVVSGVATGIDAAAMEGALDAGKCTVGVLGGGVDVVYPAGNRSLYRRTEEKGCMLSEYPPGARPFPGNFLHRNRIISGISDGVLIVEAPARSGALNTARHAFSQGRDMFVVPGNLGVDSCQGSNALLQEGAYAALSGWDVVKQYENIYPGAVENRPVVLSRPAESSYAKVAQQPNVPEKRKDKNESLPKNAIDNQNKSTYSVINKRPVNLSEQEQAVLELISDVPTLADSIMDAADLPSGNVQSILTRLAIKGLVQQHPDGRISRK